MELLYRLFLEINVFFSFFLGELVRTGDFYFPSFYVVPDHFYICSTFTNQWIADHHYNNFFASTALIIYSISNWIVIFNFNYEFPNSDLLNITNLYLYIILIEICILIPIVYIISFLLDTDNLFYPFIKKEVSNTVFGHTYGTFSASSINDYCKYENIKKNIVRVEPIFPTISIGIGKYLESFLDFFFLVLPTILIIVILIPSLGLLYNNEFELDNLKYSFIIDVIGHQWYWTYQYKFNTWDLFDFVFLIQDPFDSILVSDSLPRLLITDNPLIIPSYTNILLVVTSADVIHSWSLPSAGIKVDAIPGRMATSNLILFSETYYFGQCSELCGVNHGFMPITVRVLNKDLFFSFLINIDYDFLFNNTNLNDYVNN